MEQTRTFPELVELLAENHFYQAKEMLQHCNTVDIAAFFSDPGLDHGKILILFRLLSKDIAAEVFAYIDKNHQRFLIESLSDAETGSIINDLFLDDAVDLLEEMPANVVKKLLRNADASTRKQINQLLQYPENSAGSLMTTEFADLKKEMTVKEALAYIRRTGVDKETINTCYCLNRNRVLEGTVGIRRLILSEADALIGDIMITDCVCAHTLDDQEEVAEIFKKYDLLSMPVVDMESRLVGIITIDDIVDIIEQENTEDFHKMAAVTPSDEQYLRSGVFSLARRRIGWLLLLMISSAISAAIIRQFEAVLTSSLILASFIPMLMNTGGNAGSQSSTLAIRSLALGELQPRDWYRVMWKECRVSLITSLVLSTVNFAKLLWFDRVSAPVALTVSLTLVFTVILAKLIGGLLPLGAKAVRADPAIMASPLITTIVDSCSLVIYFFFATRLLSL